MKRRMIRLSPILLVGAIGLFTIWMNSTQEDSRPPLPTDIAEGHHEDRVFKEQRQAFFEQMHRAAPGVDWREIDRITRRQKAEERFRIARNAARSGIDFFQDTVANGQVVGHWREVGSNNQAGRSHLVEPDTLNDILYLASAGGNIWKGPKDGSDWRVLNDLFKIPDITMLRRIPVKNSMRMLVASRAFNFDSFLYSDDDGRTWNWPTGLPGATNNGRIQRALVAPDSLHTVYVLFQSFSGSSILYRSMDQGETFVQVRSFGSLNFGAPAGHDIWVDYYRPGPLYFLANAEVYTVDSTGILTSLGTIPGATGSARLTGVQTLDSTVLYAAYPEGGATDVYRSTNGGQNWVFQGTAPTGQFSTRSFAVSTANPEHLYTGGVDTYRSHDGGLTWTLVNGWGEYYGDPANKLHADIPGINSFRDSLGNEMLYINTDGGTYLSTDSLMSVQNLSLSGLNISQYYSVYTNRWDTDVIFAGSQDQGFQRATQDNGRTVNFEQTISGDYGHIVSSNGGNVIWTNYPGFTMIYPNAAFSTFNETVDFPGSGHLWLAPLMADPVSPIKAYLGGGGLNGGAHLFKLEYSSGQLIVFEEPFDFGNGLNASISAMAASPVNPDYRYVATDIGGFFVSGNAGANWTQSNGFLAPQGQFFYGASILPSPSQLGRVYVAGSGYSNPAVYVSDNDTTFVPADNGLPSTLVYDLAVTEDESLVFAGTEVGPYVYVVADDQWYPMDGISAPDQIYWSVDYIPSLHTVRFGTYGRGIWDFVLCGDTNSLSPSAQFTTNLNDSIASFLNNSENAYFYEWDFGDGTTANSRNTSHIYAVPGEYTVKLIAKNFCGTDTLTQTLAVGVVSSLELNMAAGEIKLFPNPVQDRLIIRNEGLQLRQAKLRILDASGRVIRSKQQANWATGMEIEWPMAAVAAGVYVVQLLDGQGQLLASEKMVKQ